MRQSFQKSLENLQTTYIDSLVLHSPMPRMSDTLLVWRIFEEFYNKSYVKSIGISNIYDIETLTQLYLSVNIKPSFVQNRFYSKTNYDKEIRKFCQSHKIKYQSFWSLTANRHILEHQVIQSISSRYNLTPAQVFFQFLITQNILPLTGTTSTQHMLQDLNAASNIKLNENDIQKIRSLLER